jgi:hypothetical protein
MKPSRVLLASCAFALVAVGLMIWSLFDPRPIPVIVAMSVGQVLGTLSLAAFVYVVVADWRAQVARARAQVAQATEVTSPEKLNVP